MTTLKIILIISVIVSIAPSIILFSIMRKTTKELNKVLDEYELDSYSEYEKYLMTGLEDGWLQDDNLMDENVKGEICRLLCIQADINAFNEAKKKYPKTIALSQAKYNQLLNSNDLDNDTFYHVFDKETGKYIDGYMDIEMVK